MNRVALQAVWYRLAFNMRLVTGETGRFEPVRCMALRACNLGVFARKCCQLIAHAAMTIEAEVRKLGGCGNFSWCVGVAVTGVALGNFLPVRNFVARGALGHDSIPVSLPWTIGVKLVMTVLARKSVPATAFFKVLEQAGVTLGTLHGRKRLRIAGILFWSDRNGNGCDLFSQWCSKGYPGKRQCNHYPHKDSSGNTVCSLHHFPFILLEYAANGNATTGLFSLG